MILSTPPAAQQGEIFVTWQWQNNTRKVSYNSDASVTVSIVKVYVIFNGEHERFVARKLFKIIHFGLQYSPQAFHRSIVKPSANARHTLDLSPSIHRNLLMLIPCGSSSVFSRLMLICIFKSLLVLCCLRFHL